MSKGEKFEIRCSVEEKADLYARAAELDMKPTEYGRLLLFSPPRACETVKPVVYPVQEEQVISPPMSSKRNYTGETALMFHKKQYEYVSEDGIKLWTTEAP